MKRSIVAIVGKPNVGKSTLFNSLVGKSVSIVDEKPGVTRDRIYADCEWGKFKFTLIDTGGMEFETNDSIMDQMRFQAEIAIESSNVIIFLLDVKQGISDLDLKIADFLRRAKKPIIVCVNKVDNFLRQVNDIYEYYELGLGDPIPVSSANKQGLGDLLDEVTKYIVAFSNDDEEDDGDDNIPQIAVVGHPNVGKSSLINKLLGKERMIVSEKAGTTTDAVDSLIRYNHQYYNFIDTAGIRRKSRIEDEMERYSIIRSVAAINRCDIALIMLDASLGVTDQDIRIAGIAHEYGKGAIILVNKWDIYKDKDDKSIYRFTKDIRQKLSFMPYVAILFVSVLKGIRISKIYEEIDKIRENQTLRIKTGLLNEILTEATATHEPPFVKGKQLKLFYATQTLVKPPTFVIVVNHKEIFHFSYLRYIENKIREAFLFYGTPIRFVIRERKGAAGNLRSL